jgi:hypothetical protein
MRDPLFAPARQACVIGALFLAGCGSGEGNSSANPGMGGNGGATSATSVTGNASVGAGGNTSAGTGGASAMGGSTASASGGTDASGGTTSGGAGGMPSGCPAQQTSLLIVFDHSYAMLEDWPEAAQGLVSFLEAAPAGLSVALNLYPNATCNLDSCAVGACYEPLVDFGTLPDNTAALSSAIDAADLPIAGSGSPLFLALGGALQRATDHRNDTSRETAVVFVTCGVA